MFKKFCFTLLPTIVLVCIMLLASNTALADIFPSHGAGYSGGTASWSKYSNYGGYDVGGEFTIEGSGLLLSNSAYAAGTSGIGSDADSFQTFCLEMGERIREPVRLWVSEASTTDLTTYGSGSHAWLGGVSGTGDDLDSRTAYLYTQFATGALSNYDYTASSGRKASADQLQHALWAIEGERTLTAGDATAQAWINSAQNAIDAGLWSGIGNVRVLQLYKMDGDGYFVRSQDQLYLTPVPTSVLLGIIGLGAVGLKLRKHA